MKKELFFAFGPNEAYFFSSPPSCRQVGFNDVITHTTSSKVILWTWVAREPETGALIRSYVGGDEKDARFGWNSALSKSCPRLLTWLKERSNSGRRVVFGPKNGSDFSYVAWIPSAGFLCGPGAPQSVKELTGSANMVYTNIRLAALGVDETYILIWENGTIRWDLKNHYNDLDEILENFRDKGEDISARLQMTLSQSLNKQLTRDQFIAINPSKPGDYFVYFDSAKLAMFQVSEDFGTDLQEVLRAEGITSQAIVRQRDQIARPVLPATVVPAERASTFLQGISRSVGVGANLLSIGASIAGLAACNVM